MSNATALRVAIGLVPVPSRVRMLMAARLPESVPFLLRIAAGDRDATQEAAELTGKTPETVQAAAAFFIERILFAHDSDSYRIVGTRQSTPAADLRRNLVLLLNWMHADAGQNAERSIFARRVTGAWNNLMTPERHAAYDMAKKARETEHRTRRAGRSNGSSAVPRHHNETGYSRGRIPASCASRPRRSASSGASGKVCCVASFRSCSAERALNMAMAFGRHGIAGP